jgi:hypothetical protein
MQLRCRHLSSQLVVVAAVLAGAAPSWAQRCTPLQLTQPDGAANDQFGFALALSGDTMIAGAPYDDVGANADQGSAHVYRWTGSGWTHEATLTASDGAANDYFGYSVVVSGDTAVVGAFRDNSYTGAAYVFVRAGGVWTQQAKLVATDAAASDLFGGSVAVSGDTAVVGAYYDNHAGGPGGFNGEGSAYVFVRSGTTWTQQAKLTASDAASGDWFGSSVSLSGDTAVVGAGNDDNGGGANAGSVYVFVRSGTVWTQQQKLTASDAAPNDGFGVSVSVSDNTAMVGASSDDNAGGVDAGSAYVFVRTGGVWTQQAKLIASDAAASDFFCTSVALSGNTAVVGAFHDDNVGGLDAGSAYVFVRSGISWTQQAQLTAPDGVAEDRFGNCVALLGDTAVVAAASDDVGASADQGSAWVFSRIGDTWIGPNLQLLADDGATSDWFGGFWDPSSAAAAVAISGDTAVVGANGDDVGANAYQGSAYVFVRSGTIWTQQAKLTASDGAPNQFFGWSVCISGDTAVAGAIADGNWRGSAYVFVRSGTIWTQQAKLTASDGVSGDHFGYSVALDGDTAVVGAFKDDSWMGSAYIFVRSGTTWTQQAKLTASDGTIGDNFGSSVALSGETAVVGAIGDDVGANAEQGSAYVFVRSGTIWTQQAKVIAFDGAGGDYFGWSVALCGDTAVAGAVYHDVMGNSNQGAAYVFVRSGTTWTQQAKLSASDGAPFDTLGTAAAVSGDTAVVGARNDDVDPNNDQGSAYVFVRSGTTWTQQSRLTALDGAPGDLLGTSVALSGETAVVAASLDDVGANGDQGSAWVFELPNDCFSLAHNDTLDIGYPTLAAALLPAQSGHQITGTPAAWAGIGALDTLGRSLGLHSTGPIRTPSSSIITLGGSSSLVAAAGQPAEVFGQLRASGYTDVYGDDFFLGSRGILTARTGSSLTINALAACLDGQTRLEHGASLTLADSAETIGPLTAASNFSIFAGGILTNCDTWSLVQGQIAAPLYYNRAATDLFGSSAIFGDFTNAAGAVTTIRSGTLYVFGTLTNNGTIIGTVVGEMLDGGGEAFVGSPPSLDVTGSLILGPAANLTMPFADAQVHVGGSFECAIDSNTRFDLSLATLELEGTGAEQTLEVMARDIGADARGLDRTIEGQFPVRNLHIGAAPSTVRLVDEHDNDGLGQSSCEAIYVDELRIAAGSHLINPSCRIYYRTLVNNGTVDVPGNLLAIRPGDIDGDGDVDMVDVNLFTGVLIGTLVNADYLVRSDMDDNGLVDGRDIAQFVPALLSAP